VVELEATSSSSLPVGTIIQAVAQPSDLWIPCDGGMYAKDDDPANSVVGIGDGLYAALADYWSHGEISVPNGDPMPVPDLRGRIVIGAGTDGHESNNVDRPIGRRGGDTRVQEHWHYNYNSANASGGGLGFQIASGNWDLGTVGIGRVGGTQAGASGNVPPYAVIPSFIYAGKPGPFTKVGDIKDTYPVPTPSPATTLEIEDGEIPVAPDVENNPPDGYWEAS